MIVDWTVPFSLITPQGTLVLNAPTTTLGGDQGTFLLVPDQCQSQIPLRATDNDIPQQDGETLHERFYKGYLLNLAVALTESTDTMACDTLLQDMADTLMRHVRALTNPVDGRVYWTPNGASQRMLKNVKLMEPAAPNLADGGLTIVSFQVKSPYPYEWTQAETTTTITAGNSDTLTNNGTADFYPVIRVDAGASSFTITNNSIVDEQGNPLAIVYSGAAIGGSYGELDCFKGTFYQDGDGANLSGDLDVFQTTFFPLQVGVNVIDVVGADIDILWQDAWA